MKRFKYIIILSALTIMSGQMVAGRYDTHLIDFWGGGGYSAMLNNNTYNKLVGGGGGMIGFGYEYRNRRFLFDIGPEFRIFTSRDNVLFENFSGNPYGTRGLEYLSMTKYYDFSDFSENQTIGQVMLPIMTGMSSEYWYFLAGVKVGYTVLGSYSQKSTLKTTITDDDAYDPNWENLFNHDIMTGSYASKGKNTFGLDATVSIEAGVNINDFMSKEWNEANNQRRRPLHFRAAVFADYGLVNMNISNNAPMVSVDPKNAHTISFHQSEWSAKRLNSFLVGVKFTALLQLNKPKGKKQPNPRMAINVIDFASGEAIGGASVKIYSQRTKRAYNKSTNPKGYYVARYPAGDYTITSQRSGFLPSDTAHVTHAGDLLDTIQIALIPEPLLNLTITDAQTGRPLTTTLEFTNTATNKVDYTLNTDSLNGGKASVKLKYGNTYKVSVTATDYIADNFDINDLYADMQLALQPVEKGRKYVINNLFFATNETTILPESEESLQEIFEFLNDNKDVRIRIIGHTDAVGSEEDNLRLSEGRAQSVKDNIVSRGISADRIETLGKGESEPRADNDTEEGRAQNRRVEFEIL